MTWLVHKTPLLKTSRSVVNTTMKCLIAQSEAPNACIVVVLVSHEGVARNLKQWRPSKLEMPLVRVLTKLFAMVSVLAVTHPRRRTVLNTVFLL